MNGATSDDMTTLYEVPFPNFDQEKQSWALFRQKQLLKQKQFPMRKDITMLEYLIFNTQGFFKNVMQV